MIKLGINCKAARESSQLNTSSLSPPEHTLLAFNLVCYLQSLCFILIIILYSYIGYINFGQEFAMQLSRQFRPHKVYIL